MFHMSRICMGCPSWATPPRTRGCAGTHASCAFCTVPASFTPFYEKKRGLFAHGCASYHTFVFTVWCVVSVKSMQRKKLDLTRTELELNRYLYSDDGARNRCYGSDRRAACRSPPRASVCCRCYSPTCARCCSPPVACVRVLELLLPPPPLAIRLRRGAS